MTHYRQGYLKINKYIKKLKMKFEPRIVQICQKIIKMIANIN
jgi:hypothetical protein